MERSDPSINMHIVPWGSMSTGQILYWSLEQSTLNTLQMRAGGTQHLWSHLQGSGFAFIPRHVPQLNAARVPQV